MLSAGIAILAGSVAACLLPQKIDSFWLSFLLSCFFLSFTTARRHMLWLLLASFLWTSVGIYWQLEQRLSADLNNKRVSVIGEVINIPKLTSGNSWVQCAIVINNRPGSGMVSGSVF